jgi:hypothetical protein
MKKAIREQLDIDARKYVRQENGDERMTDAILWGAQWWNRHMLKSVKDYEKRIRKAIYERRKTVDSWLDLQIEKTARLWQMRDRLAAELDEERSFMRFGTGSTKQMTETIDPRLTSLEKLERTLTADLTALGLNYNSTVSKMKEDAASGIDTEKDGLTKLLVEARDSMNEVPDMDD